MLKKFLFTLIFLISMLATFVAVNSGNRAFAVSDDWACRWHNSGKIECRKPNDLTKFTSTFIQTATQIIISGGTSGTPLDAAGISGWASDSVKSWEEGVLTNYDSFDRLGGCSAFGVCHDFWYMPEQSEARGYPVYCYVNDQGNAEGDQASDEGCIHFASNNPLLAYHTGPNNTVNGVPGDSGDWWPIAGIENASTSPGDACGYTNPGTCIPKNRAQFNGNGLDTAKFTANVEAIQALAALKNACEQEAPLGFIFCPIFNAITDGISKLIGGQGVSGGRDGLLISFLTIQPLNASAGSPPVLQTIVGQVVLVANLFYVVIFLLLIFSSSLPLGLDNYSIKKMLPKFIGAVILTQFAYVICGAVIDIFNLLGIIVPNIIFAIPLGATALNTSLGTNAPSALQTGLNQAIVGGALAGGIAFIGSVGWIMILILAIIALVAILVAFVYIILRYLVIYILVLLSPIAFACWVLPGTEKFFYGWWKNFIRVNAVFPMITGLIAVSIMLSRVIIALPGSNDATKLAAMIFPIVALFAIPKTLKWTTQGMNALAAGALGATAGKLGAGAKGVQKAGQAGVNKGKAAAKEGAQDFRAKKAGEMFGRGNKKGAALLMGQLPTGKGTHRAEQQAAAAAKEVAERNQSSLSSVGNRLQGLDLTGNIEQQLQARGLNAKQAATQAAAIRRARSMHPAGSADQGNDLYGLELQRVAMGQGSDLLGVSAGDSAMQVASVSELAQRGDFNLISEATTTMNAAGTGPALSQDVMMKGIQPSFGDVMTKAPDLVKGAGGAYNNIGAEKIAGLDRYSTERMVAHVSNGANFRDAAGNIDPVAHAAAVQNLHNEAARMAADPRIAAGMDPRGRQALNNFLTATGQPNI